MKRIIIIFLSFISLLSSGCWLDSKYKNYIRKLNQNPELINLTSSDLKLFYNNSNSGNKYTYVYRGFNIYPYKSSLYLVFYYFTVEKGNFIKPIIVSETQEIRILADIKNNELTYNYLQFYANDYYLQLISPNSIGYYIVEYFNRNPNQFKPLISN